MNFVKMSRTKFSNCACRCHQIRFNKQTKHDLSISIVLTPCCKNSQIISKIPFHLAKIFILYSSKLAVKLETPNNWIPMTQGENLKMVPLNAATKEYNDVETRFQSSIGSVVQIVEVIIVYNKIFCCASHSYSGFGKTPLQVVWWAGQKHKLLKYLKGRYHHHQSRISTVHGIGILV